jgi:hemin uptake protein HemP
VSDSLVAFPGKPLRPANHGRAVSLVTNLYRLTPRTSARSKQIEKYAISVEPELPDNSKLVRKLTSLARTQIQHALNSHLCWGNNIYSYSLCRDEIEVALSHDGQDYTYRLNWAKSIPQDDPELFTFFSILFKNMMQRCSFEQIGRNSFNPHKKVVKGDIEIWPGCFSSINKFDGGTLV